MDVKGTQAMLLVMLLVCAPVAAQTVGELASIQAETLLLRAQASRAEAKAKLVEAGDTTSTSASTSTSGISTDALNRVESSDVRPVVGGVYGTGSDLYATFLFANGSTVDARAGETIPGGFIVRELSATRIQLAKDGEIFSVGFSDIRPREPSNRASGQHGTMMPGPGGFFPMQAEGHQGG